MSKVHQGKLRAEKGPKGTQLKITITTRKGDLKEQNVHAAAEVTESARALVEAGETLDVDYERPDNEISRIRASGEPWSTERPVPPEEDPGKGFHNPYNFVEFAAGLTYGGKKPLGHEAYHPGVFSGSFQLELTAQTPLLLLDPDPVSNDRGHKTFDILQMDSRPVLRPTSLKGSLRSAFEAITGSRMSVFAKHDAPTARRMNAKDGLAMIPARVASCGTKLELWFGEHVSKSFNDVAPQHHGRTWNVFGRTMYAAWLPQYFNGRTSRSDAVYDKCAITYIGTDTRPEHGHEVECWLRKTKRWINRDRDTYLFYWRVVCMTRRGSGTLPSQNEVAALDKWHERGKHVHASRKEGGDVYKKAYGFVCKTNQNMGNKHDERVFFVFEDEMPQSYNLDPVWKKCWTQLIKNAQKIHKRDLDKRDESRTAHDAYTGHKPGQTAWSRHVIESAAQTLEPGDLCYARVEMKGRKPEITGLYPVMISRELSSKSPDEIMRAQWDQFRPAEGLNELSTADRVFGWVRQGSDRGVTPDRREAAYKGHLRIRRVTCETPAGEAIDIFDSPLPLAIMSTAKDQQALFYAHGRTPEDGARTYDEAFGLRGRKFYLHHRVQDPDIYWDPKLAAADARRIERGEGSEKPGGVLREYLCRPNGENTGVKSDQNRSIRGWVRRGTRFMAEIRFDNLTTEELGALLWLSNPGTGAGGAPRHLRVGGGKPLGFGSVTTAARDLRIWDHAAICADYMALVPSDDGAPASDPSPHVEAFKTAMAKAADVNFEEHPAIADYCAIVEGPTDGQPVHYPRPSRFGGDIYSWFTNNANSHDPLPLPRARLRQRLAFT